MTLKEQLLSELRMQNAVAQAEIEDLNATIRAETLAGNGITGGAFAGAARNAVQTRIQAAQNQKDRIKAQNAWIEDMLSKYGK